MTIKEFIESLKGQEELEEIVHQELISRLSPTYGRTEKPLNKLITSRLEKHGIKQLYTHQCVAIDLVKEGRNIVVMTPTASGKSFIYNIPVIESILDSNSVHALYLFPLKGLAQDQLKTFREFTKGLAIDDTTITAEIYDGDTPASKRTKIRANPPNVIFTNPDMLHLGICAYHEKWQSFFANLKYVVIDEIHSYRGVLGSHVAQVLRRLQRICRLYGSNPVFVACSATIANPTELAASLTGGEFELVSETGAPQGRRYFLFLNPGLELSPYSIATKIFTQAVLSGFKTIAFTKARKITELMHTWVGQNAPELKELVSSYRAGFLPEERREIEEKLFSGKLSGVISTSALELGVDIGGLDVCVLVGYPGTISSTWQRAGRVGRKGRDSLVIMIALEDALDQYFMRHPDRFFQKPVEAAVLDIENPQILKSHLLCSVAENPIQATTDEGIYNIDTVKPILNELVEEKKVWYSKVKDTWNPRTRYPHRGVSIRGTGAVYRISTEDGTLLGESSPARVLKELHPGAVYLHRGMQYRVMSLHMGYKEVVCRRMNVNFYTTVIADEDTEIIEEVASKDMGNFQISIGHLRITENVYGYRKKDITTRKIIEEYSLDGLPPNIFTTVGIWIKVDQRILDEAAELGYSVPGGLHALEHAAIAALPLYAMCDRTDIGGVSYPMNPDLKTPAIFIYDGHEGGVGLTLRGFDVVTEWFKSTLTLMKECQCDVACPSCTQDPHCGNNNEPLDKRSAILILKSWLGT